MTQRDPQVLMVAPYRRLVAMHLTIFAGTALIGITGAPAAFAVPLIFLKTGADFAAHVREHQQEPA